MPADDTPPAPAHPVPAERGLTVASERADRSGWLLLVLALTQLMIVLDTTVMNIALPSAQSDLGFSIGDRQWAITGYALTFGALLLLGGRLGDRFGRRRVLVTGLVGFAVSSGIGGAASGFGMLIAARVAQGAFAALLAPAVLALLSSTFTDGRERARAFGVFGAVSMAGTTLGLLLGGVLTEYLSWRWTMYLNVFIAVPAIIGALLVVSRLSGSRSVVINVPHAVLVTAGLFALVAGSAAAAGGRWTSPGVLGPFGLGLILLAIFVVVQRRTRDPLLPLSIVQDRVRGGALLALLVASVGTFTVFLFLTYYLQEDLGYSQLRTGLAFLPVPIALVATAAILGPSLARRFGAEALVPTGLVVAGVGIAWLTRLSATAASNTGSSTSGGSTYWVDLVPALVLLGLGIGLIVSVGTSLATAGVAETDAGAAGAIVNTAQQVGGSLGVAVLNTVAAATTASALSNGNPFGITVNAAISGYSTASAWAAALFLAVAAVTYLLMHAPAPAPAPSVRPRFTRRALAGLLLVVGSVHFFVAHLGVQALWPVPYSWARNYISDLGAVTCSTFAGEPACSPAHGWMNTAFVLQGAVLIAGVLLSRGTWSRTGKVWRVLLLLNGLGFVVIGLFPEDIDFTAHSIGAYPIFLFSGIAVLLAARRTTDHFPVGIRRAAAVLGIAQIVGLVLLMLSMQRPDLSLGIGVPERLTVFPVQLFAVLLGAYWWRTQRRHPAAVSGSLAPSSQ